MDCFIPWSHCYPLLAKLGVIILGATVTKKCGKAMGKPARKMITSMGGGSTNLWDRYHQPGVIGCLNHIPAGMKHGSKHFSTRTT